MQRFNSKAFYDPSSQVVRQHDLTQLSHFSIQSGIDLFTWQGNFAQPFFADSVDDRGCVHFTYWLDGGASCWFEGNHAQQLTVAKVTGTIGYGEGRRLRFEQRGRFASLTILIQPLLLLAFDGSLEQGLSLDIGSSVFFHSGYASTELHTCAHVLFSALQQGATQPRHPL